MKIGIIGLGYVGLPVAAAFGKKYQTIGFDIMHDEIFKLSSKLKKNLNKKNNIFYNSKYLELTTTFQDLSNCNVYIVMVPTPIDEHNKPNLNPIIIATKMLGKIIKNRDIVIYESTVYPGLTEEVCAPLLEKISKLKYINKDDSNKRKGFYLGYSPERINVGDSINTFEKIIKITSGSTPKIANKIDKLYKSILVNGTFKASSIKVAEAAKVIENIQRDVNIALVNELSILFKKLNLNTEEILKAAETKWNFSSFRPGLVGGHCIGVDPYYLTYKADEIGYDTEIIINGRKLNNSMASYIVSQTIKLLTKKKIKTNKAKILIMGFTFKENIPDIRNTKIVDLRNEFLEFGCQVDIFDPIASPTDVSKTYNIDLIDKPKKKFYDAAILAVKHKIFFKIGLSGVKKFLKNKHAIYDLKYMYPENAVDERL